MAILKVTVEELRVQLDAMTQSAPQPVPSNSSTAQLVKDSDGRKKTVVVSNLTPVHGVSDGTLFRDFCSNNLNLKPYVDEKRVRRVGKGAPQKLLVPLLSELLAAKVLRCAKELRLSADDDVKKMYINPDLSPEDAKAAYEKKLARRLKLFINKFSN